ncbi:hypothetical protein EWM64_g2492 [Hericium alpestre]|uniref:UNC-45/Cro1/She4 central domain-containing protein n=1 Tax=Hericium alpestre TaxID=135208 RepID=A0A4Z0A5K1_9AGAM|nr:hypothetical protein EWM64_g2492 [Hericium alpestre]
MLAKSKEHQSFLPDELSYLITAFVPTQEASTRSKAYLVLSAYCQGVRQKSLPAKEEGQTDPGTLSLSKTFAPIVVPHLAEIKEQDVIIGLSFLSALFQVDWQAASVIFQQESIQESLKDILDLGPSDVVSVELAHLLSQAAGHKACRAVIPIECVEWLHKSFRQTKDKSLRAAAAIAVVKLSRGNKADSAEVAEQPEEVQSRADDELVGLMKGLVVDEDRGSIADAVEGLAYLSVDSIVKEALADDSAFLTHLFSVVPHRKNQQTPLSDLHSSLLYGVLIIILNLCVHRPRLSAEDSEIEKLRRMAKGGKGSSTSAQGPAPDALDDDEHVQKRGRKVVQCGALDVVTTAVRFADSEGIRATASKILLNVAEDKENRGKILQSGGAKALIYIIRKSSASPSGSERSPELTTSDLDAIQALAKLAITSSPVQVFGPDSGAIYDSVRPFSLMLTSSSSNLLQRFEAMMALTNISSHSEEAAARVSSAQGLVEKVEFLMLENNTLVRRAATELMCNLLAGSEEIFERYTGTGSSAGTAKSKLHILLALSDVEDTPTRLAASGAMATLTNAPEVARALYELDNEHHRVLRIFTQLLDPTISGVVEEEQDADEDRPEETADPGLVHRGVVCICNFLGNLDAEARKALVEKAETQFLCTALVNVIKSNSQNATVLRPAAESLKILLESGFKIPGFMQ